MRSLCHTSVYRAGLGRGLQSFLLGSLHRGFAAAALLTDNSDLRPRADQRRVAVAGDFRLVVDVLCAVVTRVALARTAVMMNA